MEEKSYLEIFNNKNDYESQKDSVMEMPYVVLLENTNEIIFADLDLFNGHEYVDLGLQSGTLWAKKVVGGDNPLYFQWGDTEGWTKTQIKNGEKVFNSKNYKWYDGSSMTKYNSTDGKVVLDLEDDAAHAHMGGEWHMPTKEQLEELTANTTSTWTTQNGINGRLFTASNGNSLFVPAFGFANSNSVYGVGFEGSVWGSSVNEENLLYALNLYFISSNVYVDNGSRVYGLSVLGVVG